MFKIKLDDFRNIGKKKYIRWHFREQLDGFFSKI